MREFPVFIPWERTRLAAVVATPDDEPRGLVVLSTGLGAPRSHRFQMWALAAERLASRGIASVRWEYQGFHDSTGSIEQVRMVPTPLDQALAVTRFAKDATGVQAVGAAGNCYGAQIALAMAAEMPECVGAMCILPEGVEPGRLSSLLRKVAGRNVARLVRSSRTFRRLTRPLRRVNLKPRRALSGPLPKALARAEVVFLYDEASLRSGPTDFSKIQAVIDQLPTPSRDRCDLRVIAKSGLDRFGSIETQEAMLDAITTWADRCFSSPEHPTPAGIGATPAPSALDQRSSV